MDIATLAGRPVGDLGLGGQPDMDPACVGRAWAAGVNYFFFYNLSFVGLLEGLQPLVRDHRRDVVVATGSETRDRRELENYRERVRTRLDIDQIDVFFAAYVSPADNMGQVREVLDQLHGWKAAGAIRHVGATVHSRDLAQELIEGGQVDILMHRYNMAHRGAEERVLPAALEAGIPVVAFTCTRWGSLLAGHRDWPGVVPRPVDCYTYALAHPAVRLALTAPMTVQHLAENAAALQPEQQMDLAARQQWEQYGALVYGDGRDSFETEWP